MLEASQLESSSAEKDPGALVHSSLNMREQPALAAKRANSPCIASRLRETLLALYTAPVKLLWTAGSGCGLPIIWDRQETFLFRPCYYTDRAQRNY